MNLRSSGRQLSAGGAAEWQNLPTSAVRPWRRSAAAVTAQPITVSRRRGVPRYSRCNGGLIVTASAGMVTEELTASRDEEYNERMAQQMGCGLE